MISFISGNGTSRQSLVDDRLEAVKALRIAAIKFRQTAPHGRDYVGAEHQYEIDLAAWRQRQQHLATLIDEVDNEAYALTQIPGRP